MESILIAAVLVVIGLVAAAGIYWGKSDPVTKDYTPSTLGLFPGRMWRAPWDKRKPK